jgi:hypothetical protein
VRLLSANPVRLESKTRDGNRKGHMMSFRDAALLRTRLRQVNVEYSALVRDRSGEGRFVRMDELRTERRALMARLSGGATGGRRLLGSHRRPGIPVRQAAE